MNMTGNTVLITGGASGIGQGLAEAFLSRGNKVIVAIRAGKPLPDTLGPDRGVRSVTLDQADPASVAAFAEEVRRDHPEVNILINNAGIQRREDLRAADTADARAQIATNLLGPIEVTAALLPGLLAKSRAAVINVTSGLGFMPQAATPTYSATKAAMHAYTQALRSQLRGSGVQVIEIVPPYVQTDLQSNAEPDPAAIPLEAFIAEVMQLLTDQPDAEEILVERVKPFRFAERDGTFGSIFAQLNKSQAVLRGATCS